MKNDVLFIKLLLISAFLSYPAINTKKLRPQDDLRLLSVKKTNDFEINGKGDAESWNFTDWVILPQRRIGGEELTTKVKVLYSEKGIYFLFYCEDNKITATMDKDFMELWKEDVVEVFLWPDETSSTYFEYELSPLNFELPLLISNKDGDLVRWMPFNYNTVDRMTKHATHINGGKKLTNTVENWTAEFFIPYKLLRPLKNRQPKTGTRWRANLYRVDYDKGTSVWSWQAVGSSFHDMKKFGTLVFE